MFGGSIFFLGALSGAPLSDIYSPKESSLELTILGPFGLNGFLYLSLLFRIFQPYVSWSLFGGGGWAYFCVKI